MSERDAEREIARFFEAEREAGEALAPPFRELVHRPPRRNRSIRPLPIAAAAGALAVALVLLLRPARPSASEADRDAAVLSAWKAPSDVLLRTPGSDLMNQTPRLAPPVSDSIRLPPPSKGDQG